ncbi:MAG: hypothetical protein NVS3B12_26920 [Acidimicrobiales bacterium]
MHKIHRIATAAAGLCALLVGPAVLFTAAPASALTTCYQGTCTDDGKGGGAQGNGNGDYQDKKEDPNKNQANDTGEPHGSGQGTDKDATGAKQGDNVNVTPRSPSFAPNTPLRTEIRRQGADDSDVQKGTSVSDSIGSYSVNLTIGGCAPRGIYLIKILSANTGAFDTATVVVNSDPPASCSGVSTAAARSASAAPASVSSASVSSASGKSSSAPSDPSPASGAPADAPAAVVGGSSAAPASTNQARTVSIAPAATPSAPVVLAFTHTVHVQQPNRLPFEAGAVALLAVMGLGAWKLPRRRVS